MPQNYATLFWVMFVAFLPVGQKENRFATGRVRRLCVPTLRRIGSARRLHQFAKPQTQKHTVTQLRYFT